MLRPQGAYTTSFTSRTFNSPFHDKAVATIRTTAITSTPSVVMKFQVFDVDGAGTWTDFLLDAAITTASVTSTLQVGFGATDAANVATSLPLPRRWRIVVTHANANSISYKLFVDLYPG